MNFPFKPFQFIHREVHQAQFREEPNTRDHAKTGSDDPQGAGKQVFVLKMNKAEAQLNRVGTSADTSSSGAGADSVHRRVVKPRAESEAPPEKRVQTKRKDSRSSRERQPMKPCQTCVKHE